MEIADLFNDDDVYNARWDEANAAAAAADDDNDDDDVGLYERTLERHDEQRPTSSSFGMYMYSV